jgi:hypothetical protein
MAEHHRYKLIPTPKPARMPFRLGLLNRSFKFRSWKYLEQLIQNAAKSLHGAESSSLIAKLAALQIVYRGSVPFSLLFFQS